MRRCLRNWKGFGDGSVMEKAAAAGRKRKVEIGESSSAVSTVQLKTPRLAMPKMRQNSVADSPENSANSACESVGSDHSLASCCSSNELSDLAKGSSEFGDLEETESTLELFATSAVDSMNCRDRSETSATPRGPNPRRRSQIMPSEAELEKFFAAAEKNLQEQFVNKYNYDIVKDMPLEGPYEWVNIQLKP